MLTLCILKVTIPPFHFILNREHVGVLEFIRLKNCLHFPSLDVNQASPATPEAGINYSNYGQKGFIAVEPWKYRLSSALHTPSLCSSAPTTVPAVRRSLTGITPVITPAAAQPLEHPAPLGLNGKSRFSQEIFFRLHHSEEKDHSSILNQPVEILTLGM